MSFICYECHKQTQCTWPYHVPPKTLITPAKYDGQLIEVYTAVMGVSFGRCEDCKQERPCVNCRG